MPSTEPIAATCSNVHDSDVARNTARDVRSTPTQTNICFFTSPFPVLGVVRIRLLQYNIFIMNNHTKSTYKIKVIKRKKNHITTMNILSTDINTVTDYMNIVFIKVTANTFIKLITKRNYS